MKAFRAVHVSAVHDDVVKGSNQALHVEGPRMHGDEDAGRPPPASSGLLNVVIGCDVAPSSNGVGSRSQADGRCPCSPGSSLRSISAFDVMRRLNGRLRHRIHARVAVRV